ncbi:anaphase-promoting complex subunit 1 [Phtheirospermum japonicum]|uniref:Anaphase-promoting complex subunit 1 n=1 Tax=Phtheirospermum japonicum TaxID=374723 RepID=A0A830CN51_9LAMI|nr:anaphase-promoting complex subunit 1 [Phtheirospermum japonicum]
MPRGGVRELTVLTEFKPFGLTAEALDGGKHADEDYHYFLFDPQLAQQRGEAEELDDASALCSERSDHELYIRGNRIIWSTGPRVYKRFTLPSKVIKVCWCRMGHLSEALICVLQVDCVTIYGVSGEVVSVPLPQAITSIWPLPFGLLLQRAPEGSLLTNVSLSSSNPFLSSRDVYRQKRDVGHSPQLNYTLPRLCDFSTRSDGTSMSSHMILKDPLEEPQITYCEERGKLNVMWEFDERTIWTSDSVPLMASYNKAKHFFRRIWQGKGSQTAASKVFLATDDDVTPVVCFLLQEQKKLLSLRLQSLELNNETVFDIKPEMSWSISAIAAAAVTVTRPKVRVGQLPVKDVIALTPENTLLLYMGKLCLCKYVMSSPLDKEQGLRRTKLSGTKNTIHDFKVVDLIDAVEGRVNLVLNNGQELVVGVLEKYGLSSSLYNHFLGLLWGDDDSTYLAKANSRDDSEWDSFCNVITKMCRKPNTTSQLLAEPVSCSSWEFLIRSKYNQQYFRSNCVAGSFPGISSDSKGIDSSGADVADTQNIEETFYPKLLTETLDSLHAVYETLKLDNLRRRDLGLLVVLLCDIAAFLHEVSYLDYYKRDFPVLLKDFELSQYLITPRSPPSLFRWLENCLQRGCGSASVSDLPLLICKDGISIVNWARKIVSFYSLLCGVDQSGKRLSSGVTCNIAPGLYHNREELAVLGMVGEKFGLQHLDLLPAGVSLPLRHAIDKCRESPPSNWPPAAYVLLGREDLALLHLRNPVKYAKHDFTKSNLISLSTPYMLPLHPVTIPSSVSDTLEMDNIKEETDTLEGSATDGMEHIFNSSTQLRYGRDLRLNEVRRILCSARPIAIQTPANPTASDQDFQQTQLWHLAQRTTALPFGRGAFTLGTICTLLTEALVVPKLVLAGRLPAQQNATVNLDPNIRNIQELKSWPEFHNAVAAGLRLSPLQGKMSRTWILYNKPDEPNVTHAGLLLALGLHGHLRVLTITDIFQYYSQEHESTTVGLMIGLAASYRGTMQPSISKSLYVHLPARHPSSFPELELPTLVQQPLYQLDFFTRDQHTRKQCKFF